MTGRTRSRARRPATVACAALAALAAAAAAAAHARISPPVSLAGEQQLYTLAVPTEKAAAATTRVVLTVPAGFSIDSFAPSPGWRRTLRQTGSGESAVIQTVTWTGGSVPTGEDALFEFLGEPATSGTYTFRVEQTYSDGSVVDWAGPESSGSPGPTIEARSSLGGGGTPLLTVVALAVGAAGVVVAGVALLAGGRTRPLA